MKLKPLGDRVLIRPLAQPETSESGLIQIVEDKKPDEIGIVVALGMPAHRRKDEAEAIADALTRISLEAQAGGMDPSPELMGDHAVVFAAVDLLRALVRREPCVKVGDTVLFSWVSGQELTLNDGDERYLLMRESDLLAVVEDVE